MLRIPIPNPIEKKIRRFRPAEVTTRADEEPAAAGGLSSADVDAIWQRVEQVYATGLYPAVAFCLRRHGRVVIDRAIGHARGNAPGDTPDGALVPATPRTLFNIFSASKAVTAMVIHLLDDRGVLHLDDAVAEYIPEFGTHGKEWITIRHVLTHRAGIPTIAGVDVDLNLLADWERIVQILCDAEPTWPPGRRLAYHALTGGYILGEVVRRVTGRDIRRVLREEILNPLGIAHMDYGVHTEDLPLVAENAFTGPPVLFPFSWLLKRALGVDFIAGTELSNDPRFLEAIVPAGNVICTANEASRFWQCLLNEGELDGARIFDRRTVRRARTEQTYLELDLILGFPVRYGLGFILGGERVSLYGPGTPHAFGHLGFTNVVCWADPERDIAACLMTSGKPFFSPGVLRVYGVVREIARRIPRENA
jgi:CubicO group peptidase (beta-lactamase class C family)